MDLLQAAHTMSGVEMALWDLLGRARGEPSGRCSATSAACQDALCLASLRRHAAADAGDRRLSRQQGFRAAKFGWGPIGRDREGGCGPFPCGARGSRADGILLVDVGQIFIEDVEEPPNGCLLSPRPDAVWLEEPFQAAAYEAMGRWPRRAAR